MMTNNLKEHDMSVQTYEIEGEQYVVLPEVKHFMASMGIKKGFSRSNILKLMKKGVLDIEYIPQGQQKYFKADDLRKWWNGRCEHYKI